MTTADNPLVANYQYMKNEAVVERNMERLRTDARMRFCGPHSEIYRGIMDNRFGVG